VLAVDEFSPGVLARRLVEVTVDDQRSRHQKVGSESFSWKSGLSYHETCGIQIATADKKAGRSRASPPSSTDLKCLYCPT
jgi:hypothetical protein